MLKNINKIAFPGLVWILFYLCLFSFLLYNSFNYLDPDLGWHLKVGEQIIAEKSVPSFEYYNYTLTGKKWVDHEWLLDAISYWVFSKYGYIALSILYALLVIFTLIVLTIFTQKHFLKNKQGIWYIMFFQALGVLAMAPHLGVRMQEIAILLLLFLLIVIYYYEKTKNIKYLAWLPLLFFIWANTHGSFPIGIFILFFWLIIKTTEKIIPKINYFKNISFSGILKGRQIVSYLLFSLLAISATLLTPYGLKLHTFLKDYTNTYYMKHIAEWLPAYHFPMIYYQLIYSAIIATVLLFAFTYFYKNRHNKLNFSLWPIALTVFFLILAIKSRRHFPLFFIVSFPWLIAQTSRALILPEKILALFKNNLLLKIFLIAAALLSSFYFLLNTNFTNTPFTSPAYCQQYPCAAVDYLKDNDDYKNLTIFNSYGWGGFLIWQWPEKKLFIDGRLSQFQYNNHTMLEEYYAFFNEEKAAHKLEEHNIQLILLPLYKKIKLNWFEKYIMGLNEEKINNHKNHLIEYLKTSPSWHNAYSDNNSLIYVKREI